MKKSVVYVSLALILCVFLTACGGKNVKITEDMNGQTINLAKGETLTLSIEGNPTTGYSWNLTSVDEAVLKSAGEPGYDSSSTLTGAGGTYTFKFSAVEAGTTTLKLDYYRTFEKDVAPIKSFEVTVVVK
jgi:inhibitor of cysteine peptidase